jgi:hypothetical protein
VPESSGLYPKIGRHGDLTVVLPRAARVQAPRSLPLRRHGRAVVLRVQPNQLEREPQVVAASAIGPEDLLGNLADRAAILARTTGKSADLRKRALQPLRDQTVGIVSVNVCVVVTIGALAEGSVASCPRRGLKNRHRRIR